MATDLMNAVVIGGTGATGKSLVGSMLKAKVGVCTHYIYSYYCHDAQDLSYSVIFTVLHDEVIILPMAYIMHRVDQ